MAASFRVACQMPLRVSSFSLTSRQFTTSAILAAKGARNDRKRWTERPAPPTPTSQPISNSGRSSPLISPSKSEPTYPNQSPEHKSVPLDYSETASYTPPTTGFLSRLPRSLVPYGELARLDKPAGTYYLFAPCLFGTILAATYATPIAPITSIISTSALFLAGAFIMRGAGCTINDLWDRNLDPLVARTRLRPIARGAVTPFQAVTFLGAQLTAGLAILLQFPTACFWYATPSLLLVTLYPLAKRVTYYPQAVLGLTFSWGVFVAFPALGVDLLSSTAAGINIFGLTAPQASAALLYTGCALWTVLYDKIYAHQDIQYDAAAGIKSIALAHAHDAKKFLQWVAVGTNVALAAASGVALSLSPVPWTGLTFGGLLTAVGWLGAHSMPVVSMTNMIVLVNLKDPASCAHWFRKGVWYTGGAIAFALLYDYLRLRNDVALQKENAEKDALRSASVGKDIA